MIFFFKREQFLWLIRLVSTIIVKGQMIVQSFHSSATFIRNVETAIEFFNNWDVDEIVLLDITATGKTAGRIWRSSSVPQKAVSCL